MTTSRFHEFTPTSCMGRASGLHVSLRSRLCVSVFLWHCILVSLAACFQVSRQDTSRALLASLSSCGAVSESLLCLFFRVRVAAAATCLGCRLSKGLDIEAEVSQCISVRIHGGLVRMDFLWRQSLRRGPRNIQLREAVIRAYMSYGQAAVHSPCRCENVGRPFIVGRG